MNEFIMIQKKLNEYKKNLKNDSLTIHVNVNNQD